MSFILIINKLQPINLNLRIWIWVVKFWHFSSIIFSSSSFKDVCLYSLWIKSQPLHITAILDKLTIAYMIFSAKYISIIRFLLIGRMLRVVSKNVISKSCVKTVKTDIVTLRPNDFSIRRQKSYTYKWYIWSFSNSSTES